MLAHVSVLTAEWPFPPWALIFWFCRLPSCADCFITHFNGGILSKIFSYNLTIFSQDFSCWKVLLLFLTFLIVLLCEFSATVLLWLKVKWIKFSRPGICSFPWQVKLAMCEARKSISHLPFYFLLPEKSPAQTRSKRFPEIYPKNAFSDLYHSGTSWHFSWLLHPSVPLDSLSSGFSSSHSSFVSQGGSISVRKLLFVISSMGFVFLWPPPHIALLTVQV